MTSNLDWDHVDQLLDQALDLPVEQRSAFIEEVAGDDPALRGRLQDLVNAVERPETTLLGVARGLSTSVARSIPKRLPERIGPYRVRERLGQGGMGAVYRAEKDMEGAVQVVAIKVIRPELLPLASPGTHERFRRERAVLSRLEHPHIARLLDGGETEDGTPYLAMEFVEGRAITTFCVQEELSLEERLRLVQDVAHAAAYAHRQLIVHRDIKPTNILVSRNAEGTLVPKLIDFGIAKLLAPEAGAEAMTVTGLRPLTPEYAAPEQLLSAEITTATDVYALGALMYEVLTGERPFHAGSREDLEQLVIHETPPRPSLRETGALPASDSQVRARQLRGDLDRICLKALRKEPERRYGSAAEFADDIENYLQGRPVRARPATLRYRASKFSRRNRISLSAGALVFVALVGGLGVSLWQTRIATAERNRATAEAQRAEQATEFMAGLLALGNPRDTDVVVTSPAAFADSGLAYLQRDSTMDPLLRADLLLSLSHVFEGQGQFAQVIAATRLAVETLEGVQTDPVRHVHALLWYAEALKSGGRYEESLEASRKAIMRLPKPYSDPVLFAEASAQYGLSLSSLGRVDSATVALRDAVRALDGARNVDQRVLMNTLNDYAVVLDEAGRNDESVVVGARAVSISRRLLGSESIDAQIIPHNYAIRLSNAGRLEEAEAIFTEVLRVETGILGADHPERAITALNVAEIALQSGQLNKAVALSSQAVEVLEREGGAGYTAVVNGQLIHAVALSRLGRLAEGEAIFRRLLALDSQVLAEQSRAEVEFLFGMALQRGSRPGEGRRHLERAQPGLTPTDRRLLAAMFGNNGTDR